MNPLYWPLIIVIPDVDVDVLNILMNNYRALQYILKICEGFFCWENDNGALFSSGTPLWVFQLPQAMS